MNYICITDKVQFLHPMIGKVQIFALMLRQRCKMNKLKEIYKNDTTLSIAINELCCGIGKTT